MNAIRHLQQIANILIGVFILSIFILAGCSPVAQQEATAQRSQPTPTSRITPTVSPQKVRVTNQSAYTISDLKVRFPDELIAFGDILPGETTEYQTAVKGVYRYSGYQIKLDGQEYSQVPYDFLGEKPMQGYAFTYILNFDPIRKPGVQVIQLVEVKLDQMTGSALTPQPTLYFAWPPVAPTPATRLENPRTYTDPAVGYAIDFPAGWYQAQGSGRIGGVDLVSMGAEQPGPAAARPGPDRFAAPKSAILRFPGAVSGCSSFARG